MYHGPPHGNPRAAQSNAPFGLPHMQPAMPFYSQAMFNAQSYGQQIQPHQLQAQQLQLQVMQEQLQQQVQLQQLHQRAQALQKSQEDQRRKIAEQLQKQQKAKLHADLHQKLVNAGLLPPTEEEGPPAPPPPPPSDAPPPPPPLPVSRCPPTAPPVQQPSSIPQPPPSDPLPTPGAPNVTAREEDLNNGEEPPPPPPPVWLEDFASTNVTSQANPGDLPNPSTSPTNHLSGTPNLPSAPPDPPGPAKLPGSTNQPQIHSDSRSSSASIGGTRIPKPPPTNPSASLSTSSAMNKNWRSEAPVQPPIHPSLWQLGRVPDEQATDDNQYWEGEEQFWESEEAGWGYDGSEYYGDEVNGYTPSYENAHHYDGNAPYRPPYVQQPTPLPRGPAVRRFPPPRYRPRQPNNRPPYPPHTYPQHQHLQQTMYQHTARPQQPAPSQQQQHQHTHHLQGHQQNQQPLHQSSQFQQLQQHRQHQQHQQHHQHQHQHQPQLPPVALASPKPPVLPQSQVPPPVVPTSTVQQPPLVPPPPAADPKFDVRHLFWAPDRHSRPSKIVIILRGLPGSGKSRLAKMLKDIETQNCDGAASVRVVSIDDCYMQEKTELVKNPETGKREKTTKMIYEWEDDMESSYRASMAKAMGKYLKSNVYNFIIVDDWCPTRSALNMYWLAAQENGAQVFIVHCGGGDDPSKAAMDFELCLERNTHQIPKTIIEKMRDAWEPADLRYRSLYRVEALLQGSDSEGRRLDGQSKVQAAASKAEQSESIAPPKEEPSSQPMPLENDPEILDDAEAGSPLEADLDELMAVGREQHKRDQGSRPSDSSSRHPKKKAKPNSTSQPNALIGLLSAYCKKRVRWADLEGLEEAAKLKKQEEEEARNVVESEFMRRVKSEEQRFANSQREALLNRVKKTT